MSVKVCVLLYQLRFRFLSDRDMTSEQFSEVDVLQAKLLQNLEDAGEAITSYFSDVAR